MTNFLWSVAITFLLTGIMDYHKKEYDKRHDDNQFIQNSDWAWLWIGIITAGIASLYYGFRLINWC